MLDDRAINRYPHTWVPAVNDIIQAGRMDERQSNIPLPQQVVAVDKNGTLKG